MDGKYTDVKPKDPDTLSLHSSQLKTKTRSESKQKSVADSALPSQNELNVGPSRDIQRRSLRERTSEGKYNDVTLEIPNTLPSHSSQSEPKTYKEAMASLDKDKWIQAMKEEYDSLMQNGTWKLTRLPEGRKPLKNKWIFKIKYRQDGSIERYKARLVIKGYSQIYGIDYDQTYAPVVRYASIRYLLAMAVQEDMEITQMDAVTAFLQGELDNEDIYMVQPEGFEDPSHSERVCHLERALYGLKQASRVWNLKLDKVLREVGLIRSKYDSCVYYRITKEGKVYVAVYVDDLLIFATHKWLTKLIQQQLNRYFKMKDLGTPKQILGIRIQRKQGQLSMDQERFIDDLLVRFNMVECCPVSIPCDPNQHLTLKMCPEAEEEKLKMKNCPFKELVGSLQFLASGTRPDIAHAVNIVSAFSSNPGLAHWTAAKRILRYLKGSKDIKLTYTKDTSKDLVGYSDADYANDRDTRKSITGYLFTQAGAAVSWTSRKQETVATSTMEAEYMALSAGVQEAVWWNGFIKEIQGMQTVVPMVMKCDNQSAVYLAEKDVGYSARSKHIDVRHHFIREKLTRNEIKLKHVSSNEQLADIFTKPLARPKFQNARRLLGLI